MRKDHRNQRPIQVSRQRQVPIRLCLAIFYELSEISALRFRIFQVPLGAGLLVFEILLDIVILEIRLKFVLVIFGCLLRNWIEHADWVLILLGVNELVADCVISGQCYAVVPMPKTILEPSRKAVQENIDYNNCALNSLLLVHPYPGASWVKELWITLG